MQQNNMTRLPVLIICGPTGSGKSRLAIALAQQLDGVVINADSMQIYQDLPILTAVPDAAEQAAVPHALYAVLDGSQRCSAGQWLEKVLPVIRQAHQQGQLPVLVGGTGFYLHSLTSGLADIPEIPDEIRQKGQNLLDGMGYDAFRALTRVLDSVAVDRLLPNDRQRLLRVWEVSTATGKPLSQWQAETGPSVAEQHGWTVVKLALIPERQAVYDACDHRLAQMWRHGAVAEVKKFLDRQLPENLPLMKAVGVPEIRGFLQGDVDETTALAQAQQSTRHYVKRQFTWLRHQYQPDMTVPSPEPDQQMIQMINDMLFDA